MSSAEIKDSRGITMIVPWYECMDCTGHTYIRGRQSALSFLQRFKTDEVAMISLRRMLPPLAYDRAFLMSNDEVLERLAARFAAGELHVTWGSLVLIMETAGLDKKKFARHMDDFAKRESTGWCAEYVRKGLEVGGLHIKEEDHRKKAKDYGPILEKYGASVVPKYPYTPRTGDIVIFQPIPPKNAQEPTKHPDGHMQMWDGRQWVSDFKQNNFCPYRGDPKGITSDYTIYRFPDDN